MKNALSPVDLVIKWRHKNRKGWPAPRITYSKEPGTIVHYHAYGSACQSTMLLYQALMRALRGSVDAENNHVRQGQAVC